MSRIEKKGKKKKPFKIALISFVSIILVVAAVSSIYLNNTLNKIRDDKDVTPIVPIDIEEGPKGPRNPKPDHVLNLLIMGIDDARADTLMLFSVNSKTKKINLISIPRDTYYPRPGYNAADQKKINASYGIAGDSSQKARSVAQSVSNILGTTIDYYVRLDFNAVVKVVDAIGGVPIYVPENISVTNNDTQIDIEKGERLLNGQQALAFVRFRGYAAGDLGRVKAQQDFIKATAKKALSLSNIFSVVETTSNYIRTNLSPAEIRRQILAAPGYKINEMQSHTIPGQAQYKEGLSFFLHDQEATYQLVEDIYNQN